MSSLGAQHPSDELLLRHSDGELSSPEAEAIRKHLAACWQCRVELEGFERTIADCVHYRKTVLETCLPEPPSPWFDIYRRFDEIDARDRRHRLAARLLERLESVFGSPRRWAPAAALLVLAAVVAWQFRRTPAVQAAELLHKAVAAAQSQPAAPRRIQIRTRTERLTRVIGAKTVAPAAATGIESMFRAANYNWDDPLSAKSYAQWRDQLPEKHDEVRTVVDPRNPEQNCYHLRTTTSSGELTEATLKLRLRDLRAVEETLQFRNREWVEITELSDLAPDAPAPAAEARAAASSPHALQPEKSPEVASRAATPGEELQVWAALRRAGADLGDPVEVTRSRDQIVVSGVGVAPERQQQIRAELDALPRVAVRFTEPSSEAPEPAAQSTAGVSVGPKIGRAQLDLEKQLGGRPAFEQFSNQMLETTEALMSRAHALRRLAQRFPSSVEAQMNATERASLRDLRREHAGALLRLVADTQVRVEPALAALLSRAPARPAPVAQALDSWQDATEELFGEARRAEALLVAMLGGVAGEAQPQDLAAQVLASLAQLRARVEAYERMTVAR